MTELTRRRIESAKRIDELNARFSKSEAIAEGKACVYATGSFGRHEAGKFSDLDLFILGKSETSDVTSTQSGRRNSLLKRLDDIRIKAELIEVTRDLKFPEFSGDGKWLVHYSVSDLTRELGSQHDDSKNTFFTARLLLLLESKPLVGKNIYEELVKEVINAYWRDYEGRENAFMPAFLSNDILRLWRTFCVNYEARSERAPANEKAKGKIKNYKLKHSRMLTCYSALLMLLRLYQENGTVSPSDAFGMILKTPTERLEWLKAGHCPKNAGDKIDRMLDLYDAFLSFTDQPETRLIEHFLDKERAKNSMSDAYRFGDATFEVMDALKDDKNKFYRLLIV